MLIKRPLGVVLMTLGTFVCHSLKPRHNSHNTALVSRQLRISSLKYDKEPFGHQSSNSHCRPLTTFFLPEPLNKQSNILKISVKLT